jgi:transcriptional regulator with XRE-family HTH domain
MDIVLKLRELRRLRGLSQKQLAARSGIGEKTLSSFETGERLTSMKVVQLFAILKAYDLTPAEFFGGRVEAAIFAEFEKLDATELEIVRELRLLPEPLRSRAAERVLALIDGASLTSQAVPLRVVR